MKADAPKRNIAVGLAVVVLILAAGVWLWTRSGDTPDETNPDATDEGLPPANDDDPSAAQEPQKDSPTHTIVGKVLDTSGAPVAQASIAVIGPDGDTVSTALSGTSGKFETEPLPLEVYGLTVKADGYADGQDGRAVPGGPARQIVLETGFDARFHVVTGDGEDAQAMCYAGGAGLFPMKAVESDDDGVCVIPGLPAGTWTALAIRDYAGSGPVRFEVADGQPNQTVTLTLRDTPPLVVSVVDPEFADDDVVGGEGSIEEALVTIAPERLHVWSFNDVTDADGFVTWHGLTPGRWYLTVRASGYLPWGPEPIDLPLDEPLVIHPERGARISGTVKTPAGTPVSAARLLANVETPDGARWFVNRDNLGVLNHLVRPDGTTIGRGTSRYVSGKDGRFSIGGLPGGTVELTAEKEGWLTSNPLHLELPDQGHVDDVVLTLEKGEPLTGRVVSPAGGGIAGAQVRWRQPGSGAWGWQDPVMADGRGVFEIPAVPQQFQLEASAPEWRTTVQTVSRTDLDSRDLLVELQKPGGSVQGRIVGPDGPVDDVEVYAVDVGGPLDCRSETGPDGRFSLESCGQGTVLLRADAPGFGPAWTTATVGAEVELELAAPSGLIGTIADQRGAPIEDARLVVMAQMQVPGWPDPVPWQRGESVVGGTFQLESLPALPLTVTASADGYLPTSRQVELVPGEPLEVGQLELTRRAVVAGWVLDDVGGPVSNARVEGAGQEVETDDTGAFELMTASGDIELRARHWLYGTGTSEVEAASGNRTEVEIRLLDPLGQPNWPALLEPDGVVLDREERGWVVLEVRRQEPWGNAGLSRGDHVEAMTVSEGAVQGMTVVRSGARRRLRR